MERVAHVVVTGNFAGAERYVCNAANETAARGWAITVIGGHPTRMREELDAIVRWLPGANAKQALRSLVQVGRQDVCHAHMTLAEIVALAARPSHRAPVIATRHFAARRGTSRAGRVIAPWVGSRIAREIAVSEFVASHLERLPDAVIQSGVPMAGRTWNPSNRVVLLMQRLEVEKDSLTAIRAWHTSRFTEHGWTLRVVGAGSQRAALEHWVAANAVSGVTFVGWAASVGNELAQAGLFLAPAPAEPLGLAVLEAMAAGVPVVAAAAGGHLETVGLVPDARMFRPFDPVDASAALRALLPSAARAAASDHGRAMVESQFTMARHVDRLLAEYATAHGARCQDG